MGKEGTGQRQKNERRNETGVEEMGHGKNEERRKGETGNGGNGEKKEMRNRRRMVGKGRKVVNKAQGMGEKNGDGVEERV